MIYRYECTTCGNEFEVRQSMTEAPLRECPQCMKETLIKVLSANPFHLKGSGYYATDYKGK